MIFNLFRFFSIRYLIQHPFRTFLTFLGVALGIALFLSISLINDATKRTLRSNIENMTGKADLTISSDGVGFETSIAEKVKEVSDVKNVVPLIINYAYLHNENDPSTLTTMVFLGIDLLKDSSVREYSSDGEEEIIPDPLAFLNQPDSIIVTKSWSARNKKEMDDSVEILTKEGVKDFVIRGIVEDSGPAKAFNGNVVIMDIDGAMYNFGRDNLIDRVDVLLWGDRNIEDVKKELRELLGPRFKVEDKNEQSLSMQQLIQSIQEISSILGLVAFVVGFLIIINTVNTAINQRRKEIGSLRTFGAGTYHIVVLFAGEFLFLSLCSAFFGSWLGIVFANGSANQVAAGLNSTFFTNIHSMNIDFTWEHLVSAIVLAMVSSSLALVYPLIKALRVHPIEALKPQTLDFTLGKTPKQLLQIGSVGLILFLITIACALLSEDFVFLKAKAIQPIFLIAGMTSIVFMGPVLVIMVISLLHGIKMPFLMKFSLANLLKNPARTASTSVHLFLGFSLVILVSAINVSFKETIYGWAKKITSVPNVINVTSWGSVAGFQVQPLHESLIQKLEQLPRVDHSVPTPVSGMRIIPFTIGADRFVIKAFDNPGTSEFYNFIDPVSSSREELGNTLFRQDNSVLVSEPMLEFLSKKVGDDFELETPTGMTTLKIGGVIRDFASPNGVLYFQSIMIHR
jgi:putative ABC transport system permease protein